MLKGWYWLFGKKLTPAEILRRNKRALSRSIRQLDRERLGLEGQEKKLIADIKKMAKSGQMDAVSIMAKDLVRTRRYVRKFMLMRANLQAVEVKIVTLDSQQKMAEAMGGVTMAMRQMNAQLKLPQVQFILKEFEKQTALLDMKGEVMEDSINSAVEGDDDEEESASIVAQICDELGLQLKDQLSELPATAQTVKSQDKAPTTVPPIADVDEQIMARLELLRRKGDPP